MGLPERRAMTAYKDNQFPKEQQQVEKLIGTKVEWDVRWDTMMPDGYADSYAEYYDVIFFEPLKGALKNVAIDDMGKKALRSGLKKIVIDGSEGAHCGNFSFEDGTLTLKHTYANVGDLDERLTGIQKLLEAAL